jgi:uncharacterized membrane protein
MADGTLSGMRDQVRDHPATEKLKEEARNYLKARAEHAVTQLGGRLGDTVRRLGDPSQGGPGGALSGLAKGGEAMAEGKSPVRAALSAGGSAVKEKVKEKVKGAVGRGKGGSGKSKSVTIVEDIDVGVPVREAYNQWTQYQEFSSFAKGVVSVETSDDTTSSWKVKVAKSTRSLSANVTEQIPDKRIQWTTEGSKGTVKGVVTFHELGENLTRVLLVLEYLPGGFFEKTGNIWRAQGRRARLDLKLYRKFIMMRGEATDAWRGTIEDGEVTVDHETAVEEEEHDSGDTAGDGEDGEDAPRDELSEEDEPAEDELPEDEAPEDELPEDEDEASGEEPAEDDEAPDDEYEDEEEPPEDDTGEDEDVYEEDEEAEEPYEEDEEEPEEARPAAARR